MAGSMSTDLRHFMIDEEIFWAPNRQAERLLRYLLSIVDEVSLAPEGQSVTTKVKCRRRPGRKPCRAPVTGGWTREGGEIKVVWECPRCGDNGVIFGIPPEFEPTGPLEDFDPADDDDPLLYGGPGVTLTGKGVVTSEAPSQPSPEDEPGLTPQARRAWAELDGRTRMVLLNNVFCTGCSKMVSMQLLEGKIEKGDLILGGRCLECGGPVRRLVERD
jgi:hypothetical protein